MYDDFVNKISILPYTNDYTFYYCMKLTYVKIPESVTYIGAWAFYLRQSMTEVTIPENVTSVGEGESAFVYCSMLKEIKIEGSALEYKPSVNLIFNKMFIL